MLIVQMNNNGPVANGLAELNHDAQDDLNEVRNGVTGEGQGLSDEDESQINEDVEDVNDGSTEVAQVKPRDHAVMQGSKQHPQGPLVCWERFLPLQSLKVLLVENDDSTRHVVSALLRNCGYEVTAVCNGLQAWRLLEDLRNHIDIILAEVVMPCLSGIGLLSKIMHHKTCKNIPVIMMSSHDSMNVVFKCLSKGAVDFLVKPIRKNELKNLWQHVWRKCHSSSGSGSESGTRTQNPTKSKSAEESDNQTGSNDEDDIASNGLLNGRNGSDNGSGTQSSWTERAVEVDSPKPMSPWDQLADPPDSTCAQVIHSRTEAFGTNWVPVTTTKECEGQDNEFENVVMGKDLEIGVPRSQTVQLKDPSEIVNMEDNNGDKFPGRNLKKDGMQTEKEKIRLNSEKPNGELRNQDVDVITKNTDPQVESAIFDTPKSLPKPKIPNTKDKAIYDNKEIPSLELSLKRIRDGESESAHDRNVLRHSDFSAFSRYNSASTAHRAPIGNVGSCSPLDNSSEAVETESMQNVQSNSNTTPLNQRSNGSSNNNDMGSTTNNAFSKPAVLRNEPTPKSTLKSTQPPGDSQPVQNGHSPLHRPITNDATTNGTLSTKARGTNQQVKVQHHHHHYHHHHHHVHNMPQQQQQQQRLANHCELSVKNMAAASTQCGSSNMMSTQNAVNYSSNGNNSGSDQGSNGLNGSSTTLNPRGTNMESNDGVAAKGGINLAMGYGKLVVDQNRFAQREAALNKFRQKRKERCFEKKVRYQSRKKLAELRPRIRGQFVRQAAQDNKERDTHS